MPFLNKFCSVKSRTENNDATNTVYFSYPRIFERVAVNEMGSLSPVDLENIPLNAIRGRAMAVIINNLNKRKVLLSEEGLLRDCRGLAELAGLDLPAGENPTAELMSNWRTRRNTEPAPTLGVLLRFLGRLDRWDIVDDVQDFITEDARAYMDSEKGRLHIPNGTESLKYEALTDDDVTRLRQGFPPQQYDALLLYAEEDRHHALVMKDKLNNDYGLKVCLRECLVVGLQFEHKGIMQLISERCRRVIIIVSCNFLCDRENQFYTLFSQFLAIKKGDRIIIPCLYDVKGIELPDEIKSIFKLDYNRASLDQYNYWQKLHDAIVHPPRLSNEKVAIREIKNSEKLEKLVLREIKSSEKQDTAKYLNHEDGIGSLRGLSTQESMKSTISLNINPSSNKKTKKSKFLTQIMTKLMPKSAKNKKSGKKIALES